MENLKPLRQSNFSTACIRPRLPSWMRSSSGRPEAWYFLAIETTSRRFDCTNVCWACSPSMTARRSSRFLAVVSPLGPWPRRPRRPGRPRWPGPDGPRRPWSAGGTGRCRSDRAGRGPRRRARFVPSPRSSPNLPSHCHGRGRRPGFRARLRQPTPVPGVQRLRRQCNGAVKMAVQQGKRLSYQRPVRIASPDPAVRVRSSLSSPRLSHDGSAAR